MYYIRDIFLYFIIGFVYAVIIAKFTIFTTQRKPCFAATCSAILTLINFFVIARFITSQSYLLLGGFTLGNWVGIYLGVRVPRFP